MTDILIRQPAADTLPRPVRKRRIPLRLSTFRIRRRPRAVSRSSAPAAPSTPPARLAGLTAGAVSAAAAFGFGGTLEAPYGYVAAFAAGLVTVLLLAGTLAGSRRSRPVDRMVAQASSGAVVLAGPIISAAVMPAVTGWDQVRGTGWFGGAWLDLAAGPLPLVATSRLVLALITIGWIGAGLAVLAGLAGARLLALLPGIVLLVIGSVLATGSPGAELAGTLVFATTVAAHLFLTRRGATPKRVPAVLAVLAVGFAPVLGVDAAAPAVLTTEPRTPVVAPPELDVAGRSPLTWVSAWQTSAATRVFTVDGDSGPAPLRWASLDVYDGTGWSSSATFGLTGSRPAVPEELAGPDRDALAVAIGDLTLPGPWLPTPGRAVEIHGNGLLVDPRSGDLAAATAPRSYRVTAVPLGADEATLRAVTHSPARAEELRQGVAVPALVADRAWEATRGTGTDLDRLSALAQWTRANLRHDRAAAPGQSVRTLTEVVAGTRAGTMDQVAAGYALMARELGYRSRVVVGFTSGGDGTVHSDDIVAWPEVELNGVGWQPFYPVPLAGVGGDYDVVRHQLVQAPSGPGADQPAEESAEPAGGRKPSAAPAEQSRTGPLALGLASLMVAALAGFALHRRRSLRGGSPSEQVLRAWRSVQRHFGRRAGTHAEALTGTELAELVGNRFGAEKRSAAEELAELVAGLVYAGVEPSAADGRRAWQLADQLRPRRLAGRARPGGTRK